MLKNKKILIGVTGGIAAYKIPLLVRLLRKARAEVRVIMTREAADFVTPLTLSVLSSNEVAVEFFPEARNQWNNHVELGLWADVYCIAPITANSLAKLAWGMSDNLLTAVFLSARCPVLLCPSMDLDMYAHAATQENLQKVAQRGAKIIPAEDGFLASGLHGQGRMAEPETIFNFLLQEFNVSSDLEGKKIIVTAGPTHEPIDPVRFIGNRSTGKMGMAIAESLAENGAMVVLIAGPMSTDISDLSWHQQIRVVNVETADEMAQAVFTEFPDADACIMAAAVADFKPANQEIYKIKKSDFNGQISLVPNLDILKELGKRKLQHQILVGFALETNHELENARQKLIQKKVDMLILNSLNDPGAGFGHDTNKISLLHKNNELQHFPLMSKKEVAQILTQRLITLFESLIDA